MIRASAILTASVIALTAITGVQAASTDSAVKDPARINPVVLREKDRKAPIDYGSGPGIHKSDSIERQRKVREEGGNK